MQKIAFWRSIGAAYAFVFRQPLRLVRTGGLWLAILAVYAFCLLIPSATARPTSLADALRHSGIGLAVGLFYLFGLVSFAVAWHRAALLGENRAWFAALRFRRREWRFLGNGILIILIIGVPLSCAWVVIGYILLIALHTAHSAPASIALTFAIGGIVTFAVAWVFACRLALAFPAVAADHPSEPIAETWQESRGNWLRLYFASLLCGLPVWALGWFVDRVSAAPLISYSWAFAGGGRFVVSYGGELQAALVFLVYFLETALLIAFYSIAYRQLAAPSGVLPTPAPRPAE